VTRYRSRARETDKILSGLWFDLSVTHSRVMAAGVVITLMTRYILQLHDDNDTIKVDPSVQLRSILIGLPLTSDSLFSFIHFAD
jgi:hypothetical protein